MAGVNLNDPNWFKQIASPTRLRMLWRYAKYATAGGSARECEDDYLRRASQYYHQRRQDPWVRANVPDNLYRTAFQLAYDTSGVPGARVRLRNHLAHVPGVPARGDEPPAALWGPPGYEDDSD